MNELDQKRALYPRVSEIIAKQNLEEMRSVPLEVLANASIRGTQVHAYCTAWMRDLFVPNIEEEYQPYFDAFVEWSKKNVERVLHTDTRLFEDEMKFTGAFDAIVLLKGEEEPILIDIKTSSIPSKTWPLQLSAYMHLCHKNNYKVNRAMNIHLKKLKPAMFEEREGVKVQVSPPHIKSAEIRYNDLSPSWAIFTSALKCYDYFDRKEVK